ncbi:repeat protein [Fannyhessea vaginae PB189-T1-4]|uniref:Repeat protein n=1 Tax=Fannyhessea vaginae PB189-T1-4 TaxID=866774 RepID=A0ABP2J458_9ACTN|nr:InlB B-repeat-containing protein [Fannyhessea vaginae]EFL44006.1 repeat protein [Fannyhessea vaginae PB189-T1-4]
MTKKTKLHKHAHSLIQGKKHHHGAITRGSVAASVAIASTLAIASVAQAEPLEKPAALEGTHTNSNNSSTPAQGAQKGKHTQGANQGAAQDPVQNAAQGTSHNGENKPTSSDTLNSTTPQTTAPQSLTAHNTAGSASQSQNGAQAQQAGDKSDTPNPSGSPQAPADNKQPEQPQKLPNSDQVITPNNKNPDPTTKEDANQQVEREKDNKKTYTFTVSYSVEGYRQKQLLQPTEFTFTDDELTKISDPNGDGLYIPVAPTKGYNAERGQYVKKDGKYVLDTEKNASIQTYIKIDRALIEGNKNTITSTKTHIVSAYTIEYRPKTVTYYVRHMLQDPKNPDKFQEYTHVSDVIDVNNEKIHVSKTKGVVGQSLYAQPITIEGYSPEPNLVNSPVPDDDDYVDADAGNPSSANSKKKHLVLELRYLLNKHEVSYDTKGGTAIQAKTFYYGMKVDAVPEPTRKGYKFDGWTRETPNKTAADVNSSTPNKDANATLLEKMPDSNVKFVAHWKPEKEKAEYHINIWVQKADLPKPDDPTNMDNYDFVGQVKKEGKSDGTIQDADLNLTDDQIAHIAWPDSKLRGNITNEDDFNKYFMEDDASKAKTQALNNVEEPEYFGAPKKETRPLTKIRPDGTTVVNKVFNRRVYELIFANADIEKDGTTNKLFDKVNHTIITKDGTTYDDRDKDKLYKRYYRFGQTIHYTSGFPTDTETKRYTTEDDDSPAFGLGWLVANDAHEYFYVDTPPYRFDLNHFIAPQKDNKDFSQDNIRLFGEKLKPYQRVLVPDANTGGAGSIHVLVKLETEESARRNDDNNREYVVSELSYTKDDTLSTEYDYGAPTIEGFEAVDKTKKIEEQLEEDKYYEKLAEELADVWEKDHPGGEQPDDDDDEFKDWVAQKFPQLVFTQYGSDGSEFNENDLLTFKYKRKKASVNFAVDQVTPIQDTQGTRASTQEPYNTNLKKFATDYNDAVKKNDPAEGKRYANSYTFTIGGKTYTFKRPDSLPEDYEFAGWSLDPAGTQKLASRKKDGTPYTSQEIEELLKKSPEDIAKALGNTPLETGGITLYASWKRVNTIHTIDVDMDRKDAPVHTLVKVTHGAYAKTPSEKVQDGSDPSLQGCFPKPSPRPGYMFTGWLQKYTGADGTEQWLPFAFTSPILEDLEIKAQWIEDKRVKGTVSHIFLRPGYTVDQYKQAKTDNNTELLKKMVADEQVVTLSNLRPRSSYAAEAAYRNDNYYPDHTYSTFVVSDNKADNHAEFIYTPYATRRYTVYFKDKAGHELAAPEVFVSNKLSYDVAHAKVIPGYRLPNDTPLARQLNFTDSRNTAYIKPDANGNYSVEFIYDDVRVLTRTRANAPQPNAYSRVQFNTETSELTMQDGKVITTTSTTDGGALAAFNGTTTGDKTHPLQQLIFDVVKGTKAYEMPLPVPHAREGYTFTGWTSQVVFKAGEKAAEGANRLPVFSEEFPYQVIYTAHFKKTKIQFKDTDPKAQPPEGYYKVTYTADQNGRLKRTVPNDQGGTKDEILDTLTNVVVLDKYKDNVIDAPVAVPDKGFEATEGFSFEGKDEKDRNYTKHFEMIDPKAVAHRYVLPGAAVLAANETAKNLIENADQYKNAEDGGPGKLATYRFLDEKGNVVATLDNTTPGEHKVFIEVEAGREGHRVTKKVPFFYTIMPRAFLQGELDKYDPASVAANYKKYTFKSKREQGIMTGRETAQTEGDYETLAAYVYAGTATTPAGTYKLDVPAAAGRDFEANGYHYVFRGWRKATTPDSTPADVPAHFKWKEFTPDIGPKDHYKDITPSDNAAYVAMYEKIPYIVTKSEDGTVPPDSVVVSFKPAAGRTWKDGSTGPKVLYIKKGMDISKLDEHGVPIKPDDHTTKSILQVLGEKLYGYTSDWTKSSMDGITLIDSMNTGAGADGWKSNNAFQEFVAHQTAYTDPIGGVEKTIIQGTTAPNAIDFVKNISDFTGGSDKPFTNISAEFVDAPSTDAAANLTVSIKVTVTYKDSAETTHTRVYNITGALHVLGDVLEKKDAPTEQTLKDKYTSISFVTNKVPVLDEQGHETQTKEEQGQLSGADDQGTLTYLAFKKDNANYTINIPKVSGLDYTANGYHYVFTGWKQKVAEGTSTSPQTINAADRQLTFTAQQSIVFEAQYKKVPYITTKTDDGKVPDDSVVASFKPAPGRTWKDGTTGPKVFYVKKGQDVHKLAFDIVENGEKKHYSSIIDYFKDQLFDNTGWTKSSMEGIASISDVKDSDWTANNAFQEYVAKQTDYVAPTLGSAQTIIQGTQIPDAKTFISNISELQKDNVEKVEVSYSKEPSSQEAATYTVPLKVTVTYKDSASESHQKVYNLVGYLNVLGDVLEKKNAPQDETLKDKYKTITFISKKQDAPLQAGQSTPDKEAPGQVSGATEGAEQSELQYLAFKKDGANYTITIPQVTGKDYTANGYHYVFTGWKKVQSGAHAQDVLVDANQRTLSFDAEENVVYEAQYKRIPYIVTKVTDGTIPEDSVVVSFKPAPGRKWADGSTGPKVLYIKKGMDISRLDEHGRPIKDNDTTTKSILQVLGSQLAGYESDWTKSSMDGITLIKSMKDGAGADGWKSNNAFQEFVAHQKAHTEPKTIEQYQAIIQNTQVPTPNDFIKNDKDLKDLLMKNGVAIAGKENIESYKVEFVGEAPKSKVAGTYLVPLKVTIKYRDMDSESVFMLNSQLKVIYGVLYGKNKPAQDKQPIDYKVFNGNYRKVTFITDDNEKQQHKGTIIGDEDKNSVDYYVAKDQELKVRVPKILNKDYKQDGYHYKFVGWKLVPSADTVVKDDKNELSKGDIEFGTSNADSLKVTTTAGDLIYKAVYEKIKYVESKPVDGTVPADSVVVSFKPAPGRTWADGSAGPKVLYIKKGMDISRLDENGVPIKDGDHTTKSILQVLGEKLDGYASDWTKSSMDGITLIKSMKEHGAALPAGSADDAWKSNNAFQEFVAHQTPYVEPEAVSEFTIAQNDTVPTLEEFVKNLAQLKGNNIAKDDQGKPIFKIETIGKMPTSKVAATYTIPWTVTLKHADMSDTITYKCTTVLRVMGNVYNATDAKTMIDSIAASETPDKQGKTTPLTPAQQKFKDSYARVVFKSYDKDTDKDTEKGTLSGGDNDTTLTRYVKINTDIDLSIPGVNPKQKLDDNDGKGEYDYLFDHWEIKITKNEQSNSAGASTSENAVSPAEAPNNTNIHGRRGKRSVDVFPQTMLFAANGAGTDTPGGAAVVAEATNEELAASLRRLKRQFDQTYPNATYEIIARYKKVYYVTSAKDVDSVPAGFVPVVAFPAPGHTWEDGSVDPDIYYVKSGESYGAKRQEWENGLTNLKGWKYLGADGKVITDPKVLASIDKPTKALTLIAQQHDLPEITPKNDLMITAGDGMPSYNEMVMNNGVQTFTNSPRFAGWETPENGYNNIKTDKPGIYRVHFDLKYYTDEQEIDPQTKKPLYENGKVKHKVAIKRVDVNVHVLPRVITEQDLPVADTPEAQFVKDNYTKVTYRVAMGDHGFLASPNTTFYVRRGYTIDPNALLDFDKDKRAEHLQDMQKHAVDLDQKQPKQEIGVPSAIAQPGYVFYEWQKLAANDKGDVVYLAHFHKLPITHFEFETSTEAEQSFSTRLIGDAQNYPTYKPKAGTKLPDGVSVTCKGDTCTVSGTPHITDWKDGEEERVIELHFEAVDKRDPDKYGRSSYGLKKEITVRIVVKRPHVTTGGSHGGGSYGGGESIPWTELTPAVEAPAAPAATPSPVPAEAPVPAPARPRVRAARHARLPQTGDSQLAATTAEILGMGAGMISLVAGARKKKRKHEDKGNENKN